ncbi:MaoC family dehydratase [Variovorax sp. J22R133]|uniref:MaoC family dehydratase n=1 Tax=Variovorax brevis TaxID=3053503 RepID=UPI002577096C|nr:MaoC family dehydratase [Variovorax sp. J22R133]MDM0117465.1 MaoC family dehydratase [Variovorax sp. J22R133]
MNRDPLYFDDIKVGDTFHTATHKFDTDQIKAFAQQFDPQPFHLDEAAARTSVFGGLAASGWHTAAVTMQLLVTSGPPLVNGIVGAGGEVEWKAPTRPGDEIRVLGEVVSLTPSRSRLDRGMVVLRANTVNQRDEILQTLTAKLVVARRSA